MKTNVKEDFPIDFSSFVSSLPIAVFVVDDQGKIVFSNQLWLDATGLLEDEIADLRQMDALEAFFSHKFTPISEKIYASQHPEETEICVIHKSALQKTHFKFTAAVFQKRYILFSGIDITEQVRLRQVLQDKKTQFFSLINSLGDMVFKANKNGEILNIWSNNFSEFFPNETLEEQTNLSDYLPQEVVDFFTDSLHDSLLKGRPTELVFPYQCEGKERWYLAKVSPLQPLSKESMEEVIVIVREITEERKTRHQIEYKNKLINQFTSINNGPVLHTVEGNACEYIFIAGNLSSLTGYKDNNFSWTAIIHKNDSDNVLNSLEELRTNPKLSHRELVYRIYDNNGNTKWVANYLSKSKEGGEDVVLGVILNVTEVQLLNDQLKQRDRILTNTSKVAMIGGWEYDVENCRFSLTDEIYRIYERDRMDFNVVESTDHYVEEHRPLIRQCLENLISTGKHFDNELQILTGEGKKKWVRSIGSAEWKSGKITHIYGILQDIDEKKKKDLVLQENEQLFNAAFERAPVGIGLLSLQGQWLRVNSSLSRFFGFPPKELLETPINKLGLTDASNNPFLWEEISRLAESTYQLEEKYKTARDKVMWGRISINPVNKDDGSPAYFIIQIVDITENKQYEENLILAKKEAEKANKIKSDFLSTMSHEIRTPLYGVIGLTNLLLEEIQGSKLQEHLKALKFSSDSLFLLVNDILDFSKIKSGVLSLEEKPFDLRRLAEAVEEINLPKSKEGENTMSLHYDEALSDQYIGDELRIGQILNNLVNNAAKFTSNGHIAISVKKLGESENKHNILFSVKDNGIGIAEDVQPFVFDQFIQAEAGISKKYGGTGLGLAVVKGLVEAMGSHIQLTSELKKGTDVSFELLLEKPMPDLPPSVPKKGDDKKDLHKKTILLVEDNPISMIVANEYIKKWNGNVIKAVDGEDAVKKFLENKELIDLVLMDLQIPILNGFEAAERINRASPETPIIALTASLEDENHFETGDSIMKTFLIKPFIPDHLYHTLQTYLH